MVILIGVAAFVGGLVYKQPKDKSDREQQASTIYLIGDSYTSGSGEGGVGPNGWPELVINQLGSRYNLVNIAGGSW